MKLHYNHQNFAIVELLVAIQTTVNKLRHVFDSFAIVHKTKIK